ncbi:P-loop containing nucleoside triphosphate hydrolase protein [Xylariomycetidae sp. FL2044]|nr:P-loop containing nucleoside triphosphate hydrolase protein [Xylariomycetidae sp. FL2044]
MGASQEISEKPPNRPTLVLSLGLMRTGTSSMCEALTQLGYRDVYHGIKSLDSPGDWAVFGRAADATFPNLPSYTGKPFTRAEWDEVFGPCEAITDVGAVFAPQLIEAYPEAKVVLVKREFDRWYRSFDEEVLGSLFGPMSDFLVHRIEPLLGSVAGVANRKMVFGLFRVSDADGVRRQARETYERHYETVKKMVPPENLLEFDLRDGWEPLCRFLGREVPAAWVGREKGFPHVNDAEAMRNKISEQKTKMLKKAARVVIPWAAALAALGGAWALRGNIW